MGLRGVSSAKVATTRCTCISLSVFHWIYEFALLPNEPSFTSLSTRKKKKKKRGLVAKVQLRKANCFSAVISTLAQSLSLTAERGEKQQRQGHQRTSPVGTDSIWWSDGGPKKEGPPMGVGGACGESEISLSS